MDFRLQSHVICILGKKPNHMPISCLHNTDLKKELSKLNKEMLLNFIDLTSLLVDKPSVCLRKVEDIGNLLCNMHHLLNHIRPHQVNSLT